MSPLLENPERLNGKIITPDDIGKKTFNSLARAGLGWHEGMQSGILDAEALANSAYDPQELSERSGTRPGGSGNFYGISQETAEKVVEVLQKLAESNS